MPSEEVQVASLVQVSLQVYQVHLLEHSDRKVAVVVKAVVEKEVVKEEESIHRPISKRMIPRVSSRTTLAYLILHLKSQLITNRPTFS